MRTQLHHLVSEQARRRGDAPALSYQDTTVDYAGLWSATTAVARFAAHASDCFLLCFGH